MTTIRAVLCVSLTLLPTALAAQVPSGPPPEALRAMARGQALGTLGRSGLRALISASGSLGDLDNRTGAYRMAEQLEGSRLAGLRGLMDALEGRLLSPDLADRERAALQERLDRAESDLAAVPTYLSRYDAATAQAEALRPLGFLGAHPAFLLIRGRGHARWGGPDELTVFSEALTVGPAVLFDDRWVVAPALAVGRTDVSIGAFDGESGSTSLGARLDFGVVLGERWSAALHLAHRWGWESTRVVQPLPSGDTPVWSESRPRKTSAKLEVTGGFTWDLTENRSLMVRPRAGAYLVSTLTPPTTNSLGERGTGPFGERASLGALRAGAELSTEAGPWTPNLFLAWEHEVGNEVPALVADPNAFLVSFGIAKSLGRGRRVGLEYSWLRGSRDRRTARELTVVLIWDG